MLTRCHIFLVFWVCSGDDPFNQSASQITLMFLTSSTVYMIVSVDQHNHTQHCTNNMDIYLFPLLKPKLSPTHLCYFQVALGLGFLVDRMPEGSYKKYIVIQLSCASGMIMMAIGGCNLEFCNAGSAKPAVNSLCFLLYRCLWLWQDGSWLVLLNYRK